MPLSPISFCFTLFQTAYLSFSSQHLSMCRLSQAWVRVKQLSANRANEVRPLIPLTGISGTILRSHQWLMKHPDTHVEKMGTAICGNMVSLKQIPKHLCKCTDTGGTHARSLVHVYYLFMTRTWHNIHIEVFTIVTNTAGGQSKGQDSCTTLNFLTPIFNSF